MRLFSFVSAVLLTCLLMVSCGGGDDTSDDSDGDIVFDGDAVADGDDATDGDSKSESDTGEDIEDSEENPDGDADSTSDGDENTADGDNETSVDGDAEAEAFEELPIDDYPDGTETENRIDDIEYLIITNAEMAPAFEALADWKESRGIPCAIKTTEEIYEQYAGVDNAEKVRACIRDVYENEMLVWVLLGGDTPAVPHREFDAEVELANLYSAADLIASDLYFADLDGSWDANHNGIWGEFGDDMDLIAEVYLSRAPVDNAQEAADFVAKTLDYEQDPPQDFINTAVFISEDTGFSGLDSSLGLNPLASDFPDDYSIRKLYMGYDYYPDAEPNDFENQLDAFNSGPGFFAHFGHGSGPDVAALHVTDIHNLTNAPRTGVFVSTACYSGAFHSYDQSGGEAIVVTPNGGTVAYFGNTATGIGFPSGMDYIYEVFRTLFSEDNPVYRLAELYTLCRENFTSYDNVYKDKHTSRWTVMEMVLFGEPELPVWVRDPQDMQISFSPTLLEGKNRYIVTVSNAAGKALEGAQVALYKAGENLMSLTTDEHGRAEFHFIATSGQQMLLTVSKPQYRYFQTEIEAE